MKKIALLFALFVSLHAIAQTKYVLKPDSITWEEGSFTFIVHQLTQQPGTPDTLPDNHYFAVKDFVKKYIYVKSEKWYAVFPKDYVRYESSSVYDYESKPMLPMIHIEVTLPDGTVKETGLYLKMLEGRIVDIVSIYSKGKIHLYL